MGRDIVPRTTAEGATRSTLEDRIRVRRSFDVAEHARNISCWHQEYEQLSAGVFSGCVREILVEDGPRLQVFHEFTQQETSQQCSPWTGSVWVGLPDLSPAGEVRFCGRALSNASHLMVGRASSGFTLRTPRNFGIYGIVVDEDWLVSRLNSRHGKKLERLLLHGSVASRALSQSQQSELSRLIESLLDPVNATTLSADLWANMVANLVDRLLDSLGDNPTPPLRTALEKHRFDVVQRARRIALEPGSLVEGVDDLCERLHVTRRTLQNHFNRVLGMPPKDYLKRARLNAVRRELQHGSNPARSVHEIAMKWGFWHHGRFSHDYRELFGEVPSRTLRRALNGVR